MLTSSRRQNLRKGAKAFMVHSPLSIFLPSFLGTSCSISELRQDDESSPTERARLPPRKLTHPQPSLNENMLPVDLFLRYFLSFRFRVHLGVFWRVFGILAGVLETSEHVHASGFLCKEGKRECISRLIVLQKLVGILIYLLKI